MRARRHEGLAENLAVDRGILAPAMGDERDHRFAPRRFFLVGDMAPAGGVSAEQDEVADPAGVASGIFDRDGAALADAQEWEALQPERVDDCFEIANEGLEADVDDITVGRSEEHTSELQSLMRISYAVFCLKKKKNNK